MSSKNKSQLRIENNSSFPNNNTGFITPELLRVFNENMIDSLVSNEDSGSFGGGATTGSLLETASFDNSTRNMTFTKGNGTTFDVNIPDSTLDSGSFISTASISDADITFTKGDSQTFSILVNNVSSSISSSHSEVADEALDIVINAKNTSGADIGKGLAVHATGVTGENVEIKLADASVSGDMPAIGVTAASIANNAVGKVVISGRLEGIDTSGLVAGASVFVNGAGVLTSTKPTGSDLIQNIGVCGKVNASEGEIIVLGSGRSNDIPNIQNGYGWFGNSDGVGEAQSTASFAKTDINNTFTGTQSFLNIDVTGTGSFGRIESVTGSAKIIGDAFVVVNADTPAVRYAGLQVYDSGSSATASFEWDGQEDSWILVEEGGKSSFILTGPTGSKGSEVNLTNNTLPKGAEHRQLIDSNISDNGSTITLGSTTNVSGPLSASNLDSIEITRLQNSGSEDRTRIDGLAAETGSYAVLSAANTFTGGKQTNSGSNGYFQSKFAAPGSFGQKDFWILDSSTSNGITYPYVHSGFIDFPGFGRQYEDAFITEFYNSGITFDYGSEIAQTGQIISMIANASGSGAARTAQLQISDDAVYGAKGTTIDMGANTINIGTSNAARYGASGDINIGSTIGATKVKGDIHLSVGTNRKTIISGSVSSPLETVTISSNTASFDFNTSPAKTVTLVSGSTTHLDFSNNTTGQAVTILVKQPGTGTGSIEMNPSVKEPLNNMYTASAASSAEDILTVTTFDGTIYVVNSLRMTS